MDLISSSFLFSSSSIIGPISLHVRSLNNRLIFLFGDYHYSSPGSDNSLLSTLNSIFQTSPLKSDFFIETPLFTHTPNFQSIIPGIPTPDQIPSLPLSELDRVWISYWDCLGPIKSGYHGNVRLHNIEFRRPYSPIYNYDLLIFSDDDLFTAKNGHIIALRLYLCSEILSQMIDGNMIEVSRLFLLLYQDFPEYLPAYEYQNLILYSGYSRLSKQFTNIPQREKLKAALIDRMNSLISSIDPSNIPEINQRVSEISDVFNDAYTISRMIKAIYLYPDSSLIWMYAGYCHVYAIEKYLSEIYHSDHILDIISDSPQITLTEDDRNRIQVAISKL